MKIYKILLLAANAVCVCSIASAWSYDAGVYTTDGSASDINSAITDAQSNDTDATISVPSGNFTWGGSSGIIYLTDEMTLLGAGTGVTNVSLASDAGAFTNATVRMYGANTISSITFTVDSPSVGTPISAEGAGWRVTDCEILMTSGAYAIYPTTYGLADKSTLDLDVPSGNEGVYGRGPTDSWQTSSSMGTADAVYIEDCVIRGLGYVTDANSNARYVVRYNTIEGNQKIDAHGLASNSPARGVRHIEIYGNTWTSVGSGGAWNAIEIRGGTGRIFDNVTDDGTFSGRGIITLTDYGVTATWGNFGNEYQTPYNYPIGDQIGTGQDVSVAATAITPGMMVRIEAVGTTDFTAIGASSNTVGVQFIATGAGSGSGTATTAPASEPLYLWNNTKNGSAQVLNFPAVPAGAIALYQSQTGDGGATFDMQDIIAPDRDYFNWDESFDGSSGVGIGTKSEMNAITGTTDGVGFWVTDEAEWNSENSGDDGQLYVWDGAAWTLEYTPYQYPHPATVSGDPPTAPSTLSATSGGYYEIDLTWSDLSADESGFKVERSIDDATWSQIAVLAANTTSYEATGLDAETLYYFRVRAYNGAGDSAYTASDSATTDALPDPPAQPTGLSATATSGSTVDLTWTDAASTETSYTVEYSTSSGSGFVEAATIAADLESYTVTGLDAGTLYYFRVYCSNEGGDSTASSESSATTFIPASRINFSPQGAAYAL